MTGAFRDQHRARKDVAAPGQVLEGAVQELWKLEGGCRGEAELTGQCFPLVCNLSHLGITLYFKC